MFKLRQGKSTVGETESIREALKWLEAAESLPLELDLYVEDCTGDEEVYYSTPEKLMAAHCVAA